MLKKKICIILGISLVMLSGCGKEEETIYRETAVEYGELVVGKTESGSVDIGTVEQTFELDMSALQRVEISNSNTGGAGTQNMMGGGNMDGGGMEMFSQIFSMADGSSVVSGASTTDLVVSEVCVTIGEQIEAGDVLYLLEEDGVEALAQELESNVTKAKTDLDAVVADQNLTKTTAKYTYESSVAYGKYADTEKSIALAELNSRVAEKEESLAKEKETLNTYEQEWAEITVEYEKALQLQKNTEWCRDNTNKNTDLYLYVYYAEEASTTKELADSLAQELEQLESNMEQSRESIEKCEQELASAKRSLEQGKLSAEETYKLRQLAYDTAQETYEITLAYLEDDLKKQQDIYEEASEKWEEFTSHIEGNAICSKYSGVITGVNLSVGDSLGTGTAVVSLYDAEAVSMTVSMDEEDMTDIALDTMANINFTAYPEDTFQAVVTEISDASTDSDGNVTYDVTVTIEGDSSRLFQGMTGEITFITRETQEVMYVSNRAITRDGKKSYVKIKDSDGSIRTVEVKTGFSDGVNVEIMDGLHVGDVVLIESKLQNGEK